SERVEAHQLGEFQKIGHATRAFERLIEIFAIARHANFAPEPFAQLGDFSKRIFQAILVSRHSAFVPKKRAELAMDRIERELSVYFEKIVDPRADIVSGFFEFRMIGGWALAHLSGQIIRERVGQNEITISQALHERACAKPVRAMIGEIRFADHKKARNVD